MRGLTKSLGDNRRQCVVDEKPHLGSGADERQLALANRLGGIPERFGDVRAPQIRIGGKNLNFAHAGGDHPHDGRNRDA